MTRRTSHRVVGIVQARMRSMRLPRKVLAVIAGKTLLARVLERVSACTTLNDIVVATTTLPEDAEVVVAAERWGVRAYTGAVDDVLDRFYQAAVAEAADVIVRVTADDPFKDPVVTDRIVWYLLDHPELDYVSNTIQPTYPEGLDVEAFRFAALARAWREARLVSEREHVTPYIWKHPNVFRLANVAHEADLSQLRWTIDYEEDLEFARAVYARLGSERIFTMDEILTLLRREPQLRKLARAELRNASYEAAVYQKRGRWSAG